MSSNFAYANPPMTDPAPSLVSPVATTTAAAPAQSTVADWLKVLGVAALLVALFAGGMYVFVAGQADQPPVEITMPTAPAVPTQPPLDMPSFLDFAGRSDSVAQQTEPPAWQPVAYSPTESCAMLLHSLRVDAWAKQNWLAEVPEAEQVRVAQSCRWETMP